jgi:hypothetical protein
MAMGGPGRRGAAGGGGRRAARRHRRRRRRRIVLVGGAVAYGAHKISQKDVEKVEEHTGASWEELSDEEIDSAVNELGIEKQPQTEEDKQQSQQAERSEEAPAQSSDSNDDYIAELEKLSDLKDKGILTDEEFEAKKKELLGL